MDFDSAIKAHVDWKMKLRMYMGKPDKSLDPNVVCKDDQCALGKWIYSEGTQYASHSEYVQMKSEHATFHKAAADVIRACDKGDIKAAESMLEIDSNYTKASNAVVNQIRVLRKKIEGK